MYWIPALSLLLTVLILRYIWRRIWTKPKKRRYWRPYYLPVLLFFLPGCCISQIPTQYYFANDSCNFYLPDYSQAVQVRDNCCIDSTAFYQTPNSGTLLVPGVDVTVTLTARDCYGNTRSMTFDVIVIDSVPPTFFYDSTQFLPVGQYQNDQRIFKLYITQDTTQKDDFGNPAITQYYRNPKGYQPVQTNIYDDGYQVSHLDDPNDWRAQIFTAPASYTLSRVRLKLYRTGYDKYQDLIVEVREMEGNNPGPVRLSIGHKRTRELFTDEAGGWYFVAMRPTTLYQGQRYVIIVRLNQGTPDQKIEWLTNQDGYPAGYAIWTNEGPEETGDWQRNFTADRLFEIWGTKI